MAIAAVIRGRVPATSQLRRAAQDCVYIVVSQVWVHCILMLWASLEKLHTQSKELGPMQRKSHLRNYTKSLYVTGLWVPNTIFLFEYSLCIIMYIMTERGFTIVRDGGRGVRLWASQPAYQRRQNPVLQLPLCPSILLSNRSYSIQRLCVACSFTLIIQANSS